MSEEKKSVVQHMNEHAEKLLLFKLDVIEVCHCFISVFSFSDIAG